ncbi:TIGR04282 family arsenosugar biosynthesis glycosyltransferase [Rhodovibrionaceae bacterium A322]
MQRHLILMSRAPRYGMGKRRLAAGAGDLTAWQFHRRTTRQLLSRLNGQRGGRLRWHNWLAVTPDLACRKSRGLWAVADWQLLPQGPGDLGQKMGRLLSWPARGPVVLVGSDIPGLQRHHIEAAFQALDRASWQGNAWVLGPSMDQGYWLIGSRRRPHFSLPEGQALSWANCQELASCLEAQEGLSVPLLSPLRDVDDLADLQLLKTEPV